MTTAFFIEIANKVANPDIVHYLATLFGAIAMYIFSLFKGFEGATPALRKLFPNRSQVYYDRLDFLLVTVCGSIIGTIFFQPHDSLQGLSAGFGWVGALSVLTNPKMAGQNSQTVKPSGTGD